MRNRNALLAALLALALLLAATVASAATSSVTLAWDANTEPDLAGYKLYQGTTAGGPYTLAQTLGRVTTTQVAGLADGTYYWTLTAFDASGNESGRSNECSFRADTTGPAAPGVLRITGAVRVP